MGALAGLHVCFNATAEISRRGRKMPLARRSIGGSIVRGYIILGALVSRFVGSILLALMWATNCSASESLYLTTSDRLEHYRLGEGYTFIGPYFTSARMVRWISITKAAAADKASTPSD